MNALCKILISFFVFVLAVILSVDSKPLSPKSDSLLITVTEIEPSGHADTNIYQLSDDTFLEAMLQITNNAFRANKRGETTRIDVK